MILKKLILKNFRNYISETIKFNPNINFIIGNNAQGKTNIIESIYYASYGKSFRAGKDNQLIRYNEKILYIGIEFESKYGNKKIEIRINDKKKKEIKINRLPILKTSELLGNFNVIIFSPDDLKFIKEGPSIRRKFIDRQISQINKVYYNNLLNYYKILNQRNAYLKKCNKIKLDKILLETLDEKLVENGIKIIKKRDEFINLLNDTSREIHLDLSENKENLKVEYISSILINNLKEYDKIKEEYINILKENLEKDLKYQYTSYGPHKDDINIKINNKNLKIYGSQGQNRTTVLSIVLSVLKITMDEIGENPILLLDDVFSELDKKRKNLLVKFTNNIQTFITTTDLDGIEKELFDKSSIYNINNGEIRRI